MGILTSKMGVETLPKVSEVLAKVAEVKQNGYFSKVVTTDNKEYFFVTADAGAIESKQDDFLIRFSNNHQQYFIVPIKNSGGFKSF